MHRIASYCIVPHHITSEKTTQNDLPHTSHLLLQASATRILELLDDALDDQLADLRVGFREQLGDARAAVARRGEQAHEPRVAVDEDVAERGEGLEEVRVERQVRRHEVRVLLARQEVGSLAAQPEVDHAARRRVVDCRAVHHVAVHAAVVPIRVMPIYTSTGTSAAASSTSAASTTITITTSTSIATAGPRLAPAPTARAAAEHGRDAGAGARQGAAVGAVLGVDLLVGLELGEQQVEGAEEVERRRRVEVDDGGQRQPQEQVVGRSPRQLPAVEVRHPRQVRLVELQRVEPVYATFVAVLC